MLTANDIREVRFSKAVGGYKQDEVDALLDAIEEDYSQYEARIAELTGTINSLENEIESYKNSQSSLQSILLEAQKLADKTVSDAKEKAAMIINEAKAAADNAAGEAKLLLDTFDVRFNEKKAAAENELEVSLAAARKKQEAVELATADAVKRQQALFDKTRIEIAAFKSEILALYKKQLEIINEMPDCVAMDATRAAEAVTLKADEEPDVSAFVAQDEPEDEDIKIAEAEAPQSKGFVFNDDILPPENEDDEEVEEIFKNGFFRK